MAEAEAISSSVIAAQDVIKPPARSRGRPRRKGGPSRTVVPTLLSPITRTDDNQHTPAHDPTDVRPREERSYKEFFPDLDIAQQLPIVRSSQRENDALPTSETTSIAAASLQNKVVTEENGSESSGTSQTEVSHTNGKLLNGGKSPSTTTESVTSGVLGAISKTLTFARNQLQRKENGTTAPEELSPDFEESDLSSVSDTAATSSEDAASSSKSILKHGSQEKSNMEVKAGDSNPYQALSTRPMHGVQDVSGSTVASEQQVTLNLPKPSFWKIQDPKPKKSKPDRFQNTTETLEIDEVFKRPDNHYIRYIEPTEIDLFETVEYDMDEQDEAWLRLLNAERRKENLGSLSTDLFETIMDQIEKEWFDLVKNLPKQSADEPALDSACAICDDGECENSNAIVFCDGCNLAVHQDCYGIPYIPEGQWLCRKCMVSPEFPVSCLFCPNEGGAFKQTNTNKWAHLLCAIWIPEVGVSNSVYMEPIDNIENIPKSRWKLSCVVCRQRTGACIQCDNKHCFTAFHVTCARKAKLYMKMKTHNPHYDGGMLRAYCDKHTPRDYKEHVDVHKTLSAAQRTYGSRPAPVTYTLEESEDEDDYMPSSDDDEKTTSRKLKQARKREQQKLKGRDVNLQSLSQLSRSSKAARAHQHHYTSGAPIAPEYIIDKLESLKALRSANHLRRKTQLVITICRYWSLKRESRRGAPLLKRLHLEPWTASSSQTKQTEVEKARKAAAMMSLRADLERVRMLSEQVQKRERHKLERLRKQKAYLEIILFPLEYILKPILEELMELDKKDFFAYPVTDDIAPDYRDVIRQPMAFSDMVEKLNSHTYSNVEEFEADLQLICRNSMTYNKADTAYYKLAQKMELHAQPLLKQAKQDYASMKISEETGILDIGLHPEIFTYNLLKIPTAEELAKEEERRRQIAEQEEAAALALKKKQLEEAHTRERQERKKAAAEARAAGQNKDGKRSTRSQHNQVAALDALKSRPKLSSEAKRLLQTRAIELHRPEPLPTDKKVQRGYLYVSETETEDDGEEEPQQDEDPEQEVKQEEKMSVSPAPPPSKRTETKRQLRTRSQPEEPPKRRETRGRKPSAATIEARKRKARTPEVESHPSMPKKKPRLDRKAKVSKPTAAPKQPVDPFEHGRIVWARVIGFPAHPAKVSYHFRCMSDPDQVLVQFYEVNEKHQWGWIYRQEIAVLGDPETDTEKLRMAQRTRKLARITEVKRGYLRACSFLDIDGQAIVDQVFGADSKKKSKSKSLKA
ncbi:hypothetical protein INT44_003183 [Umbelopsis vinacea]|uniref:Peregrin n=1 Tax=Umbelopsis vinacea TaxID=44442 RepID=A0A8H7Q7I1_9FUNG|nr:hypothetical protein INT44_003183 [Umbelopsis vinacea]